MQLYRKNIQENKQL